MKSKAPKLPASDRAAMLARAKAKLAKRELTEFCCYIDPNAAKQYRAEHLKKIAADLEKVERGETTRLFITAPPRHWKSSQVSEKFSAWFLARNPLKSVIIASHAANLALGFSRNVRDNIYGNPRFKRLFPEVKVNEEFSSVQDWALVNSYRSSCRALGVGTGVTGRGADLIILDDPVADDKEAYSKTQRDSVWTWYCETLRDRLNPGGAIVLVMSRWHGDDLAGRLLQASRTGEGEQWEQLHLPALDEAGNALWPERWPKEELLKIKQGVGSRAFAARFQGAPKPDEGNVLESRKLVMIEEHQVPRLVRIVRRWDLAFSERQGADYVAGAKLGEDMAGNKYILHVKRIHGRWTTSKPQIIATAETDGVAVTCGIEANGTQLGYFQDILEDPRMQRFSVVADKPEGTKEMRASVWGSRLEDGIIKCVRGPWNQELFDEMDYFPNGESDDVIDGISGAWALLATGLKNPTGAHYEGSQNTGDRFVADRLGSGDF